MAVLDPNVQYIPSLYGGGGFYPMPLYLINHCLQAPDKPYMAESLAEGWFRNPANQTSVHFICDQTEAIQTRDLALIAWGCGNGNNRGLQTEHVGYAEWSAAEWRTPTMLQCMRNSAKVQAWTWYTEGIKKRGYNYYPEWLSLVQIASGVYGGLITHNDARLVWEGTTHTDPGINFPFAELKQYIWEELDKLTGWNKTGKFGPDPAPAPTPEDDAVVTAQDKKDIAAEVITQLKALTFTASDAFDAEQASRAGKEYTAPSLSFVKFFESLFSRNSMSARDVYALRNFKDAAGKIVQQIKDMLMDNSPQGVLYTWKLKFAAFKPTGWDKSYAEMLVNTFQKVTGASKPVTTGTSTAQTEADTDVNA